MSKYDGVKEQPDDSIIGAKYVTQFCEVTRYKGSYAKIIQGFPPCPECGEILDKVWSAPGGWKCNHCDTVWTTRDLVTAIENESALIQLSIRNITD